MKRRLYKMDNDKLIRMYENDIKEYKEKLQEHLEKIEYIKSRIVENSLICVNLGILDENNIPEQYEFIKGLRKFS